MRKLGLIVSLFLPLVACDTAPNPGEVEPEVERTPLGKADAIGSCEAPDGGTYCGGPTGEGNCWCDDLCEDYGDCCGDKEATCDAPAGPELCLQDEQCDSGFCDHTECLSNCPEGMICPAVCWGQCAEPEPAIDFCQQDDECDTGYCDHSECLANCPDDSEFCPAVCWGQCGEPEPPAPSCEGACGGQGDGCWCDEYCQEYGDCCGDYEEVCLEPDCDAMVAAFQAETAEIRACEQDSDCGQVLTGTSCGCSRNWVAREGADIDLWDSLRDDAMDAGCELPGMISTCDCPAVDGFVCNEGVCGWNYL